MPLKNIKKISAARDYCAALDYLGEVFVWGKNHYGQLGLPDDVVKVPTKVDSQCLDIEAGEGALVLVHDDHVKIAGFQAYPQFQTVSFDRRPISFAVGDFYAAFVDSSGDVHSVGGLFDTKKRSFFSIKPPQLKFTKPPPGFFPGKVEFLTGKYSYHAAIIDN
jgi:Regulator of chromosome condensation (RCC1) repeat